MPLIQNFSVPRGNSATIVVDVTSDVVGETLVGATIYWNVYPQFHGVATTDSTGVLLPPVVAKLTGHGVEVPGSPLMEFVIMLDPADTVGLMGNFYHEAEVVDEVGNHVTVMQGVMTVTQAEVTQ